MDRPPDDTRRGRAYAAPEVTVFYDRGRCRHYAECIRGLPQVFGPTRRPWIRADLADAQAVAEVVRRCPTGALHDRLPAAEAEEPGHPTSISPAPRGRCWSAAIVSWTPPGAHCARPEPRCAPAAAPRTSPSVTAHAASTPAPPAAPGTRRRHPSQEGRTRDGRRNIVGLTWAVCQVAGGWAPWRDRR